MIPLRDIYEEYFTYHRNEIQKNFLTIEKNNGLLTSYFLHSLLKILVLNGFEHKVFNALGCQRKKGAFFSLV